MTHQAPEDLRARLDRAAPSSYPALDVENALERGRRTVRRRRVGSVLAAAVAVAVVAVGSIVLGGGLRLSSPQPADPSHVLGFVSWSLPETVSGGDESDYMVVVHTPDGERQQVDFVHVTVSGQQTFARTVIDLRHPLASWKAAPGSQVVLGVVPSTAVSRVQINAGGMGPNISVIPHVGWTAFSFVLGRSGAGPSIFRGMQWSDLQHRPVDAQGRPGTVASVGSGCWVTSSADHREFGLDCGDRGMSFFASTISAPAVLWALGPVGPRTPVALGVPHGSTNCIVKDFSGQEQPLSTVPLGQYEFGLHVLTVRDGNAHADSVRCRDSSGVDQEYRLP